MAALDPSFAQQMDVVNDGMDDPKKWEPIIEDTAKKYNISPIWLKAQLGVESGGKFNSVSEKGAKGPAQFMDATGAGYGVKNPFHPAEAIPAMGQMLREAIDKNKQAGDPNAIFNAYRQYHGGPDTKNWGPLTNSYPDKIAAYAKKLGWTPDQDISYAGYAAKQGKPATQPPAQMSVAAVGPDSGFFDQLDKEFETKPEAGSAEVPQAAPEQNGPKFVATVPGGQPLTSENNPYGFWHGVANAGALGYAPEIGSAILKGVNYLTGNSDKNPEVDQAEANIKAARDLYNKENPGGRVGGELLGALIPGVAGQKVALQGAQMAGRTLATQLPETAGAIENFLSGAVRTGSRPLDVCLNITGNVARGAAEGALAGGMQTGLQDGSTSDNIKDGAVLGGVVGGPLRSVLGGIENQFNTTIDPNVARTYRDSQRFDSALRPSQVTNNNLIKGVDNSLMQEHTIDQLRGFTRDVSRTMGGNVDRLDTTTFPAIRDGITQRLANFANQSGIQADRQITQDLGAVAQNIQQSSDLRPGVRQSAASMVQRVATLLGQGGITGQSYRELTGHGSELSSFMKSDNPLLRQTAIQLRTALDDGLERSSPAGARQGIQEARRQYKISVALEPLVEQADSTSGLLDPTKLAKALSKNYDHLSTSDLGDIQTLARIGQQILPPNKQGGIGSPQSLASALWEKTKIPAIANFLTGGGEKAGVVGSIAGLPVINSQIRKHLASDSYNVNTLRRLAGNPVPGGPTLGGYAIPSLDLVAGMSDSRKDR